MLGAAPPAWHTAAGFLVGEAMSYGRCSVSGKIADTFTIGERGCYECTEALTRSSRRSRSTLPASSSSAPTT
jgi:hypothetical protein